MDDAKDRMITALSALAYGPRLDIFRYLVRAEPAGAYAGNIAEALDMRANTLSANLSILTRAGLISSTREGRFILYRANLGMMDTLLSYLTEDCCGGRKNTPSC
ncbi:ArsR family transcriptional regulator [Martelella endophytica]|uniref:ArsR family transcriptional regulator n=2 Tax=Martelella endophytica TaxID=1486262 RepID=A0A0D5LSC0_MAREN|nr:ArsR family transcriptional regulator [Martelella endophytica]